MFFFISKRVLFIGSFGCSCSLVDENIRENNFEEEINCDEELKGIFC